MTSMTRWTIGLLALAAALLATSLASAAPGASTVRTAHNDALGAILVGPTGLTLYHLTSEKRGSIVCSGSCATQWPPLVVAAGRKPVAGPGVSAARLGTIERPDGRLQVTYGGLALYRFAGDGKPGETGGQGVGKTWYAVTGAGSVTKTVPVSSGSGTSPSAPAQTTPTSSVPSDGMSGY